MSVNSLQWYYAPTLSYPADEFVLEGDEWHHCHHVLRKTVGENILLISGKGLAIEGSISKANRKQGLITLHRDLSNEFDIKRPYKVTIAFAPTKSSDRTEFAIEKIVELGVDEIYFLDCHHNERHHIKYDRLHKIMVAAAKQSRKIFFPSLLEYLTPVSLLEVVSKKSPLPQVLACHLDDGAKGLKENYSRNRDVVVLVGPEGGFSDGEIEAMRQENVSFVHLGPYRLRVETAVIAACSGIHLLNQD